MSCTIGVTGDHFDCRNGDSMDKNKDATVAKNIVEDVKTPGAIGQQSDVASTENVVRRTTASGVEQKIESQAQGLQAFGIRGTGRIAVFAVVIIALA